MSAAAGPRDLLREVGLLADGPAPWGRPITAAGPGVYLVELPAPPPAPPLELARVGKWLERATDLRLDGRRPTSKELLARLASFWLPGQPVLFIGSSSGSVGGRVLALARTVPGERRPYAAGVWLNLLSGLEAARVWWASTDAPDEYEDALLDAFAAAVPAAVAQATPQPGLVLPWGVLRRPTGERRAHGITGLLVPDDGSAVAAPPSRTTTLPPAPRPRRPAATGGRTRAPRGPTAPAAAPARPESAGASGPPSVDAVHLSADGLERLQAELRELVEDRRPAVVKRVAAAREHGDLRENAEYHAAREELGFVDGRIHALQDRLRRAVVVEATGGDTAAIGSDLVVEVDGERQALRLVGSTEANAAAGRISVLSPVGRALVGARAGDEVTVVTPGGEIRYRVVEVG